MKGYTIDGDYLIKVRDYMLPKPRLRRKVVVIDGEWLPVIGVDVGRCQ